MTVERGKAEATEDGCVDSDLLDSGEPILSSTADDLDRDIITLRDYLFISITTPSSFEMHRLVQFAARVWLESNG